MAKAPKRANAGGTVHDETPLHRRLCPSASRMSTAGISLGTVGEQDDATAALKHCNGAQTSRPYAQVRCPNWATSTDERRSLIG